MKYIEYIYLSVAIGLMAVLITMAGSMSPMNYVAVIMGILLSTFMYAFRRRQRRWLETEEERRLEEKQNEK